MKLDFLNHLIHCIARKPQRNVLPLKFSSTNSLSELLKKLMSSAGDVSAIVLATEILDRYSHLSTDEKLGFFQTLESDYNSDQKAVRAAFSAYDENATSQNLSALFEAVEPPRQELLRRLNRAPNATYKLVTMRADLLKLLKSHPELKAIDNDFIHLLISWFNRGFLVMQSIAWSTPASILEKIIRYEAVHEIKDWNELRSRLEPENRRCFAFFHPAIVDEPLIFVEVALTEGIPNKINDILHQQPVQHIKADTATFYSISNCQPGLQHVSFGNFLIKQVVQELRASLPNLKKFVTLSPITTFHDWLKQDAYSPDIVNEATQMFDRILNGDDLEALPQKEMNKLEFNIKKLAVNYLLHVKDKYKKYPADPVARFHLGNGAKLHQINSFADMSEKGRRQSIGVMVNYMYDLDSIEINHENYISSGTVNCSSMITKLDKQREKTKRK